jgi:hypothetical protein
LLDIYRTERSEEALASYDRALAIKPDDPGLLINRAHLLSQLGRPQDALASSDRALAVRPGLAEALNNRAVALVELSRLEEALASHAAAVAARPDFAEAHWNEALCRLSLCDYAIGWEKYEWRWRCKFMAKTKRDFVEPLWLGKEDLSGKSIFLHAEQGLGDTLQFCRYAAAVAAEGATVTLGVPAPLVSLLRTLPGVARVVSEYDPSWSFDFHCPLMSLPLAFATRVETIPAPVPYLWPNPFSVAAWRERLARLDGVKFGLVWAGSGKVRVVDRAVRPAPAGPGDAVAAPRTSGAPARLMGWSRRRFVRRDCSIAPCDRSSGGNRPRRVAGRAARRIRTAPMCCNFQLLSPHSAGASRSSRQETGQYAPASVVRRKKNTSSRTCQYKTVF